MLWVGPKYIPHLQQSSLARKKNKQVKKIQKKSRNKSAKQNKTKKKTTTTTNQEKKREEKSTAVVVKATSSSSLNPPHTHNTVLLPPLPTSLPSHPFAHPHPSLPPSPHPPPQPFAAAHEMRSLRNTLTEKHTNNNLLQRKQGRRDTPPPLNFLPPPPPTPSLPPRCHCRTAFPLPPCHDPTFHLPTAPSAGRRQSLPPTSDRAAPVAARTSLSRHSVRLSIPGVPRLVQDGVAPATLPPRPDAPPSDSTLRRRPRTRLLPLSQAASQAARRSGLTIVGLSTLPANFFAARPHAAHATPHPLLTQAATHTRTVALGGGSSSSSHPPPPPSSSLSLFLGSFF